MQNTEWTYSSALSWWLLLELLRADTRTDRRCWVGRISCSVRIVLILTDVEVCSCSVRVSWITMAGKLVRSEDASNGGAELKIELPR